MVSEEIQLEGHIIDSLILSKVLDEILTLGGDFEIKQIHVGRKRGDRSGASIEVFASTADELTAMLARIARHGAVVRAPQDVKLVLADTDGVFPEGFYSTTNQTTQVRWRDCWVTVRGGCRRTPLSRGPSWG